MDYLDFDVEILQGQRDYPVAAHSPAGDVRAEMRFPYDQQELESRLKDLHIAVLRSIASLRQVLSPEERVVQEFGQDLFDALITGELRRLYDATLFLAGSEKGVRIRLRILAPELAVVPWEYLYDRSRRGYLCLSNRTPVIRFTEIVQSVQSLTIPFPLRVLVMIASPSDRGALGARHEQERIKEALHALEDQGLVELTVLAGHTWRDLQGAMNTEPNRWHIFHFIGHGGFDTGAGEGVLALENEQGRTQLVRATRLALLLTDHRTLRLVILNVCEGARGDHRDSFSSTAGILAHQGIPAVLAMQYQISNRAAVEFTRTFYTMLAKGLPVDGAVSEARKAMQVSMEDSLEWGTPVLYLRSQDGQLFDLKQTPPGERQPEALNPRPAVKDDPRGRVFPPQQEVPLAVPPGKGKKQPAGASQGDAGSPSGLPPLEEPPFLVPPGTPPPPKRHSSPSRLRSRIQLYAVALGLSLCVGGLFLYFSHKVSHPMGAVTAGLGALLVAIATVWAIRSKWVGYLPHLRLPGEMVSVFLGLTVIIATLTWITLWWLPGTFPASGGPGLTATRTIPMGTWSIFPGPAVGAVANELGGITAISANDVWAVGDFRDAQNSFQTPFAHYDGSAWSVISAPALAGPRAIAALSSSDIWAVGSCYSQCHQEQTLAEHYDGARWSLIPTPSLGVVSRFQAVAAISSVDVWAVGYTFDPAAGQQTLAEHWDGSSWDVVPTPQIANANTLFYAVAAASATDVWAVGDALASRAMLIEHWDGSTWQLVASPPVNGIGYLSGITAISPENVWAVGWSAPKPGQTEQTLIEHWDGKNWKAVPSPNARVFNGGMNQLTSVTALAANDIWAVGADGPIAGRTSLTLIEHWDGTRWSMVTSPNASGTVSELLSVVAVAPHNLWAVGECTNKGSTLLQALIEHYS